MNPVKKERLRPARVTIDGEPGHIYPCVVMADQRWNGFAIPAFTRGQVQAVIEEVNSYDPGVSSRLYWLPNGRLVEWAPGYGDDDPYVQDVGPDEDGLFWPGAFAWTWTEVQ